MLGERRLNAGIRGQGSRVRPLLYHQWKQAFYWYVCPLYQPVLSFRLHFFAG